MANNQTADQKKATEKLNESQREANVAGANAAAAATKEKLTPEEREALKKSKFKEIAGPRVNNAIKTIDLIGNCSDRNNYSFNTEQIEKIIGGLKAAVKKLEDKFAGSTKSGGIEL